MSDTPTLRALMQRNLLEAAAWPSTSPYLSELLREAAKLIGEAALLSLGEGQWMICETHPDLAWPHDDCAGPGCPPSARGDLYKQQMRHWRSQAIARGQMVADGYLRIRELEQAAESCSPGEGRTPPPPAPEQTKEK